MAVSQDLDPSLCMNGIWTNELYSKNDNDDDKNKDDYDYDYDRLLLRERNE